MKVFKKAILLIVLICIVSTKTNAYDFEVNGIYYNIVSLEDLTCEVTRNNYALYSGDIIVPDKVLYNGKEITVVRIGKEAFSGGNQVTSVKLPNTIKEIGRFAFRYTKISMIDIPNSVKTIEAGAFQDCINLKSFKMGNGIEVIGSNVFSNCINISSITFNNIISNISEEMFSGCTSLTEVKNVDNIKVIGKKAFSGCKAMQPILPPKIEQIGEYAFDECISVNTLIIPSSCMIIGDHAFSQNPKKIIYKDSSAELKIGIGFTNSTIPFTSYGLFNSIDTIYLGRAIEYIGDTNGYPYEKEITPLKSVTIGDNLCSEDIKKVNFSRARHITFGKKITQIKDFRSYDVLDSLVVRNETPPDAIGFSNKIYINCKLYVPKGCKTVYESANVWKNFWNIIEISVNNDEDHDIVVDDIYYALDVNNKTAEVISNPNGYTGIINIPNTIVYDNQTYTVTNIGNNAFDGCTSLTSIALPSSLKRIKTGAFSGCTSLGKVIIQDIAAWCGIIYDGTDSNGDFPLGRAQHLYSDNNTEITEVIIPAGVTRIEPLAFRDAKFVTSVTIPNSVTYIGREAFRGMHRLTSVNLPQGITSIEPYLLQDCEALITINIPEGVTNIGEHTFRKCYALTRINIPSSVTTIGSYAFRYCNSLTDVYCNAENVPETNTNAFDNSPIAYATLHVPQGSVDDYKNTLPWNRFGTIVAIGDEVPQETIEIASANGMVEFANRVDAGETSLCAKLTKDINLSSVNNRLVPIGREDSPYRGTFDGQKHKITGLKMDIEGNRQGLFGSIMNAQIKNFSIDGSITYYGGTGVGVIGWSEGGTIRNVHSSLNITINSDDSHHIGGICGSMRTGTKAIGCSFSGKITDTANTIDCIGGIGGYSNEYCLYENCANYGTISFTASSANVGGICGYVNNNNFIGVRNCLNVGTLRLNSGTPDFGGAIIGHLRKHGNSVFENNYMLNGSAVRAGGENDINNVNKVNAQQLASGEICYKLNGNQTLTYWYQNLFADEDHTPDPYPVLDPTHEMVLYNDAKGYYNANDPDGIRILSSDSYEGICYDLQGRMLSKPQKGINIIRYSDGTSKKVLVK